MPIPASRPSAQQHYADESQGGQPIRRRPLRRRPAALNLLLQDAAEQVNLALHRVPDTGPYRRVRSDLGQAPGVAAHRRGSGALMPPALMRPVTPSPRQESPPPPMLLGVFDVTQPTAFERRAGAVFLESLRDDLAVDDDIDDDDGDNDDEEERPVERNSYSRTITAMRARTPFESLLTPDLFDPWEHVRTLNASDSHLPRDTLFLQRQDSMVVPDLAFDADDAAAAHRMLDREMATRACHGGKETVESDIRRAMAEQSYATLKNQWASTAVRNRGALQELRHYVRGTDDANLRGAALRVLDVRVDPQTDAGFRKPALVYQSVSGFCRDVNLREVAEVVWTAIQDAPVDAAARETLRALLLYNLADCAHQNGFHCINGTFQRLLAPLDKVYPGVQTMQRTPYEIVEEVALTWRAATALGARTDTPADWRDFESACAQKASAYFTSDSPLYPIVQQQLQRATTVCREALLLEA